MWDLFISYSSKEKTIAEPIYNALLNELWVWWDDAIFTIGDSISQTIEFGLNDSKMGLVILSENFFSKEKGWTEKELNSLLTKNVNGENRILPIWYKIEREFIVSKCPLLADIKGIKINCIEDFNKCQIIDAVRFAAISDIPISYLLKKEEVTAIRLNIRDFSSNEWEPQTPKGVEDYVRKKPWQTQDVFVNIKNRMKHGSLTHIYSTIDEAKEGYLINKQKYEKIYGKLFTPNVGEESYGYVSPTNVEVVTFRTTNMLITNCYYTRNDRTSINNAETTARIIDRKIRMLISKKRH